MRLVCPNCGAQYEVDASLIPDAGRDVQCSNCGHTWFQRPTESRTIRPAPAEGENTPQEDAAIAPESDGTTPAAAAGAEAPPEPEPEADPGPEAEPDEAAAAARQKPEPRPLDEEVAGILREEAEREAAARAAEAAAGLETQAELGLSETSGDMPARERLARMRGADQESATPADTAASRRDLLPDIEELNSTLTASPEDEEDEEGIVSQEARRRSGFRLGFSLTVLLMAALTLIYVYAPKIAEALPQTTAFLDSYVNWVNGLRLALDGWLQRAVEKLTALVSQMSGEDAG